MYRNRNQHFIIRRVIICTIMILISTSLTGFAQFGYDITVETDKPQYYPGEDVIIFGWLAENGTGVPSSGVCINVTDPEEYLIFGGCMLTNETGYYEAIITLEQTAVLGVYDVLAHSVEYDIEAETTFEVILENDPPNDPTIDGPTNGKAGTSYDYTFTAVDPDGTNIWYYVDWGDDTNSGWVGPYASGQEMVLSHTWDERGTYTIKAKAKDPYDEEGPWGSLEVTMPRNRIRLFRFFDIFPNVFPQLRLLLGL